MSNLGTFVSIIFDYEIKFFSFNEEEDLNIPYVDDGCKFTKIEFTQRIKHINKIKDSDISVSFYEHPTNNFKCQGKPVLSNSNFKETLPKDEYEIPLGVGVYKDLDNIERVGRYSILFLLVGLLFQPKTTVKNNEFISTRIFLIFIGILLIYCQFVFTTIISAASDFLIPVVIGNVIFIRIAKHLSVQQIIMSIIALSIFPLFLFNSNITIFWFLILYSLNKAPSVRINKKIIVIPFFFIFSTLINFGNYFFLKNVDLYSKILFSNGRHKGGLININDGFQSAAFVMDILVIFFVIYINFANFKKLEIHKFINSLLLGFVIWLASYLISQFNPHTNFFIIKLLGLPEIIDTIATVHEDGINWRGVTSSHELTGFWLSIVASSSSFMYLKTKNNYYLIFIALSLYSLSLNSQRTALVLFFIVVIYLFFKNLKLSRKNLIVLFTISIFILLLSRSGIDRLSERLLLINFNSFEITNYNVLKVEDSFERIEKYDLNYIEKPEYNFVDLETLEEFYQLELGTKNPIVINSFLYLGELFGRENQWIRFLYFNDLNTSDYLFGKGPGQSYEVLDVLIEKPHSLYLSIFYQYGLLGIFALFYLIINTFANFLKNKYRYIDFICILFFINGIKNEFIFTHNHIVFFTVIFVYATNNKARDFE